MGSPGAAVAGRQVEDAALRRPRPHLLRAARPRARQRRPPGAPDAPGTQLLSAKTRSRSARGAFLL
eukprot:3848421-Rhodomonas_salina.1